MKFKIILLSFVILGEIIFISSYSIKVNAAVTAPAPGQYVSPGTNPFGGTGANNYGGQSVSGRSGKFANIQQVGLEIRRFIENILIPIIMGIALLVFLFGILKFISKGDDETARAQGRQFMFWGIIGLTVMVSVWGLVQILAGSLGERVTIPTLERLGK